MVISGILIIESTVLTATVFEARAESLLYCTENSAVLDVYKRQLLIPL